MLLSLSLMLLQLLLLVCLSWLSMTACAKQSWNMRSLVGTGRQVARCRHRGMLETCEDSMAINQCSSAVRGKSISYRSAKRRNTSVLNCVPDCLATKSLPLYSEGLSRLKS